jgi:DNA adenine methylase
VGRSSEVAAPFLKWAGGKRSVLHAILPLVPDGIETYHEAFVGGGALFFALAARGPGRRPVFRRAILSDTNAELIACYSAIRSDLTGVLSALAEHRGGEEYFYRVRDQEPSRLSLPEQAARTIYLNRNGYNGLFRVNRSGKFNVPFGQHAVLKMVSVERLRAVSAALRDVTLRVCDFEACVAGAGPADFVYFDPPYVPVSASASFTAYGAHGFGEAEQRRLAATLRRLGKDRVPALLSNSDCPTTRALYAGLPVQAVRVARAINSVASGRGRVGELLVRNFRFSARTRLRRRANPGP